MHQNLVLCTEIKVCASELSDLYRLLCFVLAGNHSRLPYSSINNFIEKGS